MDTVNLGVLVWSLEFKIYFFNCHILQISRPQVFFAEVFCLAKVRRCRSSKPSVYTKTWWMLLNVTHTMQQATSHWSICWSMIRHFFICPESNPSGRVEEVSVGRNCCIVDPLWTLHSVEPWVSMSTTVEIVAAIIILWQTLLDSSQVSWPS